MPIPTIFFDLGDTLVFDDAAGTAQRFDDTLDVLQLLQARGWRLGLLSNQAAGTSVAQVAARLDALRLSRYVEEPLITLSTEIAGNNGKPQRPIFDLALAKAGHAAAGPLSVFVTETAAHVAAARAFGWRAILLKRSGGPCVAGDGECAPSLSALLALLAAQPAAAGSNLELAPPPKVVGGFRAVPIDISSISARLTFDAASQSASGEASLNFRVGRHAGCPIFDLRQTPAAVFLDGAAVPVAAIALQDFGGGAQAGLRVLQRVLDAGSTHQLRIVYAVGLPQASTAGSYPPQLTWSAGPRLVFNFGFTDLGPGRYLEAFVPANLSFDQHTLALELRVLNTAVAHQPITNGQLTLLGNQHWRIDFPSRSTALSPLLELRPADTLASASQAVVLPVSGQHIDVTAWKLAGSAVDVAAQAARIAAFLVDNENSSGRYLHGPRFTALLHIGGMEYDGATTSSPGPLRHEAFHSWWGRGLKPASACDGWFDEAWTTYHDNGASGSLALNFADPPVTLAPRNPWVRSTPPASYTAGERLFRGLAALTTPATLRSRMNEFYAAHHARPATTEQLEAFLLARTGQAQIVDAFHRFVYGLPDPAPIAEVWLRDDRGHGGENDWPGRFWDSPDLWVRHRDDDGLDHQNPESGQDNWLYARVRNRSANATARHLAVSFAVKAFAGTQFTYPADFLPALTAATAFELGPGETRIVKARWPRAAVPPAGTHACLLAALFTRFDSPVAGKAVWQQNNLAQKNLSIVDLKPNRWFVLPFVLSNRRARLARTVELELVRPRGLPALKLGLIVDKAALTPALRALASPLHAPGDGASPSDRPARRAAADGAAVREGESGVDLDGELALDCGCAARAGEAAHAGADGITGNDAGGGAGAGAGGGAGAGVQVLALVLLLLLLALMLPADAGAGATAGAAGADASAGLIATPEQVSRDCSASASKFRSPPARRCVCRCALKPGELAACRPAHRSAGRCAAGQRAGLRSRRQREGSRRRSASVVEVHGARARAVACVMLRAAPEWALPAPLLDSARAPKRPDWRDWPDPPNPPGPPVPEPTRTEPIQTPLNPHLGSARLGRVSSCWPCSCRGARQRNGNATSRAPAELEREPSSSRARAEPSRAEPASEPCQHRAWPMHTRPPHPCCCTPAR